MKLTTCIILTILLTLVYGGSRPTFDRIGSRIINGTEAPEGAFPYMVSITDKYIEDHYCNGVILDSRWILTTAQCIHKKPTSALVGTNNYQQGGTRYYFEKIIPYPEFNPSDETLRNNIGLFKTSKNITFNDRVKPITIPWKGAKDKDLVVMPSWGYTETFGRLSEKLHYINLRALTLTTCKRYIPWTIVDLKYGHMCAYPDEENQTGCNDQGGPLVLDDMVVGLESRYVFSCDAGVPKIYTDVFFYNPWIKDVMKNN